jgi:hypothetical protein
MRSAKKVGARVWRARGRCAPPHGDDVELVEGLLRLLGHTPALLGLRIDLAHAGTFVLTSDQFHPRENCEEPCPLGWLMRDHAAWWRRYRAVRTMAERTGATRVFGHDAAVLEELQCEPAYD